MNQPFAASNFIGCGWLVAPGIATPVSPTSGGSAFARPKIDCAYCQKLLLPTDVELTELVASATAWYQTVTPDVTRLPVGSITCAWIVLYGGRIAKTEKSASRQCIPRLFHPTT